MSNFKTLQKGQVLVGALLASGMALVLFVLNITNSSHNNQPGSRMATGSTDHQSSSASSKKILTKDNQADSLPNPKQAVRSGAWLIDVRTPAEFADGHAQAAINWPLDQIQSGQTPQITKDHQIFVYCRSGNRSAAAKQLLERQGFADITNLGGLPDVQKAGFEIVK